MREPEKCTIDYCGYSNPRDEEEMTTELLGLKNLIKRAEERMSMLEQSRYIAEAMTGNLEYSKKEFLDENI